MPAIQVSGRPPRRGQDQPDGGASSPRCVPGTQPRLLQALHHVPGRRPRRCLCLRTPAARTGPTRRPRFPCPPMPARGKPSPSPVNWPAISVRAGNDPVIVEGPDLASPSGQAWRLPRLTAEALDCRIVLVVGFSSRMSVPAVVADVEHLRDRLAGVVVNGVTALPRQGDRPGFHRRAGSGRHSRAGSDSQKTAPCWR